VTAASWSRCDGDDCIRLPGLPSHADVQVRPATSVVDRRLPPMAGRLVKDGADLCFVPRFPFVEGTPYTVVVEGAAEAVLVRPRPDRVATTEVAGIRPTATEVPRNLLRLYVWFSAPMSEGYAARHVRLTDDEGEPLAGALLPVEYELWDAARRRLTVLLDPARIKRGLAGHRQAGYPLRSGEPFRLVVDEGFPDAGGVPLLAGAERRYQVGDDERRHVAPGDWAVTVPSSRTREPLTAMFGRPLDDGMLARCLHVVGPDGRPVQGRQEIGRQERSWQVIPLEPWVPGPHKIRVDPVLEDLAGNSVSRVFDRDLSAVADEPTQAQPVILPFLPR
jgi:hypothetical protein